MIRKLSSALTRPPDRDTVPVVDNLNASGERQQPPFFGAAPDALKILNWGQCDDGSFVLEIQCHSPTGADDLPSNITDLEHRDYKKWGFDAARNALVYYSAPPPSKDSSHAE